MTNAKRPAAWLPFTVGLDPTREESVVRDRVHEMSVAFGLEGCACGG